MSGTDFDQLVDRTHTQSIKWDKYAGQDVLPLWVADTDFVSPPAILDALHKRVEHGVFGYTHAGDHLNETVCDYLQTRLKISVDPSWILWLPGIVPALSMACGCAGQPGDRVLTCTPVYPPFLVVHRDSARVLDAIPMMIGDDGRYLFDWPAMEQAVTNSTRVFMFCNPHNPVGRVFTAEEVERVAMFCQEYDLVFCSDEIHCDLILDETTTPHVSALSLDDSIRDRCITLMAASKTYNVAGLACAFAVIPNATLRRQFRRVAGKLLAEISPLGFAATDAAFRYGGPWRTELIAYLRSNRELITKFVAERLPGVSMTPVEATYLAWLDVRRLALDDPCSYFEQHGLGFSDGRSFGAPGFVRMNFGCPRSLVELALSRFESAVRSAETDVPQVGDQDGKRHEA